MFRSGWILILALVSPVAGAGSDFDHALFLGSDTAEVCDRNLTIVRPPPVDERLGAYVRRLSPLRNESDFHAGLTLGFNLNQIHHVLFPPHQTSETNLTTLARLGLGVQLDRGALAFWSGPHLVHREHLTQPLTEIRVVRDGRTGYVTLVGWIGRKHLRYEAGRMTPIDHPPIDVADGPLSAPARDGADHAVEAARLAEYAHRPDRGSLVLEAVGEVAERIVARVEGICRGEDATGGLSGGTYPNALLGLGAYALANDQGLRAMVADAINEHLRAGARVRWLSESGIHGAGRELAVYEFTAPGCPSRTFSVPADPFRDAVGWGVIR